MMMDLLGDSIMLMINNSLCKDTDLLNDQRLSANGDSCAVIAWSPGQFTYLALISSYDLVPLEDPNQPIPVDQIVPPLAENGSWVGMSRKVLRKV